MLSGRKFKNIACDVTVRARFVTVRTKFDKANGYLILLCLKLIALRGLFIVKMGESLKRKNIIHYTNMKSSIVQIMLVAVVRMSFQILKSAAKLFKLICR